MDVTNQNLAILRQALNATFREGFGMAAPQHEVVAMRVPSTTGEEKYGWLGQLPGMREWVGDRVIHGLKQHDYAIKNKDFELTIGVARNAIRDDQYGVYAPLFREMGYATAAHPSQLVYSLLKLGFSTLCYDGQYFFDTDHPVLDEAGAVTSVANTDGGAGAAWFLFDSKRPLKPILWQVRQEYDFQSFTASNDLHVFMQKEFLYGVDGRSNVGFGLWQTCWGSKQTLNKTNYATAREALLGMKGDYGRPLGGMPDTLVVGPSLEGEGLEIVNAERDAAGATNVYKGTAKLVVVPWLA